MDRHITVENVQFASTSLLSSIPAGYYAALQFKYLPDVIKSDIEDLVRDPSKTQDDVALRIGCYLNKQPIFYFDDREYDHRHIFGSYSGRAIEKAFSDVTCRILLSSRYVEPDRRINRQASIALRLHAVDFNSETLEAAVKARQKELILNADAFNED